MVALPPQARRLRRGPRMASFTLRRQARRLSLAMKKTLAHFELAARVCRDAAELADKLSEEHFEEGDFAPAVTRAAKAMDDSVALVYETTLSEIDAVLKARFDARVAERRGLIQALLEEAPEAPEDDAAPERDEGAAESDDDSDDGDGDLDDDGSDVEFDDLVNELVTFSAKIRDVATHLDHIAACLRE
jgi:hypothetical protein